MLNYTVLLRLPWWHPVTDFTFVYFQMLLILMASRFSLPTSAPLKIHDQNASEKWKIFVLLMEKLRTCN